MGGYIQLDGSPAAENTSWLMNASFLPIQCATTFFTRDDGSYLGPVCPRNDMMMCACTGTGGRPKCPAEHQCRSIADRRCVRGITIEFLLRPSRNAMRQGNVTLFEARTHPTLRGGGPLWVDLSRHGLSFRAEHPAGARSSDADDEEMIRPSFNGTGRASSDYLFDGHWHHLVFRRDSYNNEISIWIDGQNPRTGGRCELGVHHDSAGPLRCWQARGKALREFMNNLTCVGMACGGFRPPLLMLPTVFDGAIDEVALYEHALSDDMIYAHWRSSIVEHKPYSFEAPTAAAPPPTPIHGTYDLEEYAPGTRLPSPSVGNPVTQGVRLSPLQQLRSWPGARYHAPPLTHRTNAVAPPPPPELQALSVSWSSGYLAGGNQPWYNRTNYRALITATEEIAASVFGYSIYCGMDWGCQNLSDRNCSISVSKPGLNNTRYLLAKYPSIPWEISELRALKINQSLPESCYLRNNRSEYIDPMGRVVPVGGIRTLRPMLAPTADKLGCPFSLWNDDARLQNQGLRIAGQALNRTPGRVWDDAEFTYIHGKITEYGPLDPVIVQSYEEAGIKRWPDGSYDWDMYYSRWYSQFKSSYRDALLHGFPDTIYFECHLRVISIPTGILT
eukprot:COSAG01_NODE_748_length_13852_cov_46.032502_2_plen_616_part_00